MYMSIYIYIYMYVYIYIYIYISGELIITTPNPPTNIVPTNIARTQAFRELPYEPGNSTPLNEDCA